MKTKYGVLVAGISTMFFFTQNLWADCASAKAYLDDSRSMIAKMPEVIAKVQDAEQRETLTGRLEHIKTAAADLDGVTTKQTYTADENERCRRDKEIIEGFLNAYLGFMLDLKNEQVKEEQRKVELKTKLYKQIQAAAEANDTEEVKRLFEQLTAIEIKSTSEILSK
jgi:hypothetical protein